MSRYQIFTILKSGLEKEAIKSSLQAVCKDLAEHQGLLRGLSSAGSRMLPLDAPLRRVQTSDKGPRLSWDFVLSPEKLQPFLERINSNSDIEHFRVIHYPDVVEMNEGFVAKVLKDVEARCAPVVGGSAAAVDGNAESVAKFSDELSSSCKEVLLDVARHQKAETAE